MDFKNVPNTTQYPIAPPSADSFNGGVSAGAMDPQAYAGATLNTDEPAKRSNKGVYIGIIAMFAVMTASSLGFFVYMNGQSARASSDENKYAALLSGTPNNPNGTPIPKPTSDLDTFAITLTPTPKPYVTIFPTLANRVATKTPTPNVTVTPARGNRWAISFDKKMYSKAELPGNIPQGSGTLYTPLEYGKTLCIDTSNTFFTWKKNSTTIERLCDRLTPTATQPSLVCYQNSPGGLPISASLLASTDCANNMPPQVGTYIMFTRIYYECDSSQTIPNAGSCKSKKEVFSDDFNFTN